MRFWTPKRSEWVALAVFALCTETGLGQVPIASSRPGPALSAAVVSTSLDTALADSSTERLSLPEEVLAAIKINGRPVSEFARVLRIAGKFYATADQFAHWRLKLPDAAPLNRDGVDYYPLQTRGISAHLSPGEQTLSIIVPATAFADGAVDLSGRKPTVPLTPGTGIFLNYDFQISESSGDYQVAGLVELGFFSKAGFLTTRFADRDVFGGKPIRLETQFVHDFPGHMSSLSIGDSVSAFSPWSRQVYYGGVRWASKFSTQPAFLPYVLPSLTGLAAEPSTLDVYVNNVRTAHSNIEPGPFSVQNVPVISGQGDVRMLVTDILGRQQVINQPYIYSRQLLREGINEYSFEAGMLRHDLGTRSFGYKEPFFAGTFRRGISDSFTLNLRGEALARTQAFGVGADLPVLPVGLVSGGMALSHGQPGWGGLAYAQVSHRARSLGISGMILAASSNFQQLGMLTGERAARLIAQAQISRSFGNRTTWSVGILDQQRRRDILRQDSLRFRAATSSLGIRLPWGAYLTFYASYSPDLSRRVTGAVTLTVPLAPRRVMVSNTEMQGGQLASTVDLTQQLPVGNGYGYRARFNTSGPQHAETEFTVQNNFGRYTVQSEQSQGGLNLRLQEAGSLVWMGKYVVPSRWLNDSFAIVEVPHSQGVRILSNNQFSATISHRGVALVPNLVPYDTNTLSVDDSGVPVEMQVDFSEKTFVPMPRTGVVVKFKASEINGALFVLVLPGGAPMPVGTKVRVNDDPQTYEVALRGEVFVPSLTFPARLHVNWDSHRYEATVQAQPGEEPLPRLGPIICKEVAP